MKTKIKPSCGWAVIDSKDSTIMERSDTGMLDIFYSLEDAQCALRGIKFGCDSDTSARLRIIQVNFTGLL